MSTTGLPRQRRPLRLTQGWSWETVAVALLLGVLGYLILAPVALVIWGSFREVGPGEAGAYTLSKYIEAYSDPVLYRVLWNSLLYTSGATLVSLVLGAYLAWVTERTNTPLRGLIYALALFPIIIPGILKAISWSFLLNPRIGLINKLGEFWFGATGPIFDLHTMGGMIWVQGVETLSTSFLLLAAAFRAMNPSLEEAAATSGAGLWHSLRTVTLPLVTPAILATTLLIFIRNLEAFEVPAVAGIPAKIPVFSTLLWLTVARTPRDLNLAAAYAMVYLVVALVGLWLFYKATAAGERYATVTGKGYRPLHLDLGPWRWVILAITLLILFAAVVLPALVIVWTSLLPYYAVPGRQALAQITLSNYQWIWGASIVWEAVKNNLVVGVGSALAAALLAVCVSWIVVRSRWKGRQLLDAVVFSPIAIPGMVMGVALIWVYLTLPIPIYGTLWVLFLGFVTKYVCVALRATHTSFLQLHREMEEASDASGASKLRTFFQVIVPLIMPGILGAFVYVLSLTFTVLSLPVLLSHTTTRLLPTLIWDLYLNDYFGRLCALAVLMFAVLIVLAAIARAVAGRIGVRQFP